jgi:hypothetical protein
MPTPWTTRNDRIKISLTCTSPNLGVPLSVIVRSDDDSETEFIQDLPCSYTSAAKMMTFLGGIWEPSTPAGPQRRELSFHTAGLAIWETWIVEIVDPATNLFRFTFRQQHGLQDTVRVTDEVYGSALLSLFMDVRAKFRDDCCKDLRFPWEQYAGEPRELPNDSRPT